MPQEVGSDGPIQKIFAQQRQNSDSEAMATLHPREADFDLLFWRCGVPDGFGARPPMSFFLYNQDGEQGIARPFLDGRPGTGRRGPSPAPDHPDVPKYHQHDNWDAGTNAPSHNFVYDFEVFRYFVRDDWRQVLEHDAEGAVVSGVRAAHEVQDLFRALRATG